MFAYKQDLYLTHSIKYSVGLLKIIKIIKKLELGENRILRVLTKKNKKNLI